MTIEAQALGLSVGRSISLVEQSDITSGLN